MAAAYERGNYMFAVTNQGFGESKNAKTPYFFLEGAPDALLLDDGSESPVNATYTRIIYMYLTDKTIEAVSEYLKSQGWPGGKLSTLDPDTQHFFSFIGERVLAVCKHEPGIGDRAGEMFDKWEIPRKEQEATQNMPGMSRKLDALFGKKTGPAPAPKPAAKPAPRPAAVSNDVVDAETGDEIPF